MDIRIGLSEFIVLNIATVGLPYPNEGAMEKDEV